MITKYRFYLVSLVLLGVLFFLQYRLWFEAGGIRDMIRLRKELAIQTKETELLKKHNEELLFQVARLQNSKDAVESRARNELGMIKKGETFYQIIKSDKADK